MIEYEMTELNGKAIVLVLAAGNRDRRSTEQRRGISNTMDWTESLRKTIDYIEKHLLEDIDKSELGQEAAISPFYLQKGFKLMTGITISEYIRNRRLYLAAQDILLRNEKIIDAAFRYGYESAESFTRAFQRFHGISPAGIRKNPSKIKTYLPLKISVSITGGDALECSVEKMDAFKMVGFCRRFDFETSYQMIPLFWEEFCAAYMQGNGPEESRQIVSRCRIGEFGLCAGRPGDASGFDYFIAGIYDESELPDGMAVYELPATEWAKFRCTGPLAGNFQALNTRIFNEWLPENNEFEIAAGMNLEWYSCGDTAANDYESGIWIPVKRKSGARF